MNILISTLGNGGIHWMNIGLANAFAACGHKVRLWNYSSQESPIDVVRDFEPHLWIGNGYASGGLSRAARKAIRIASPNCKTILYVPAHPKSPAARVKDKNPHLIFDVGTPEDVAAIDEITPYIDGVFIHHHWDASYIYLDGWQNHCGAYFGVPMAYDGLSYEGGSFSEELACDISMIGGAWGWKLEKMKPWIYPLCQDPTLNIKLFGQGWGVSQGLGPLPEQLASSLWKSTKVNIAINEPQAGFPCDNFELPEQNERPFKVIPNGFCISDHTRALTEMYFKEGEIETAKTPAEFHEKIYHYLKNPNDRIPFMKKGRQRILADHTYFDRISDIFDRCGMPYEQNQAILIKQKWLNTISSSAT